MTLGLNWYLNFNAKIVFDVIHAFLDHSVQGDSEATVFALRAQVEF
jgi:phosphate-selective porin OprO and OprP